MNTIILNGKVNHAIESQTRTKSVHITHMNKEHFRGVNANREPVFRLTSNQTNFMIITFELTLTGV